jgi:hypothetical protein
MNEKLTQIIEQAAEKGVKTAESLANFAFEQSPILCNEIIRWGWVSEIMAPLSFFIMIATTIVLHFKFKNNEFYKTGDNYNPPVYIFNICVSIFCAIGFCNEIVDVLYPLVAPRLYLMDIFSKLLR